MQITESQIRRKLHEVADCALWGDGAWPADRESIVALERTLIDMGLEERSRHGSRNTLLGARLDLNLMLVFMGAWDPLDAVHILLDRGYLDSNDADKIWALPTEERMTGAIRKRVRRAYLKFCNQPARLS
jgi:hypothetical protein